MRRVPIYSRMTLVVIIAVLLTAPAIHGEQPDVPEPARLDIDTAVELAMAYNLGIRSSRIDAIIAQRDFAYRFNVLMPQLSAQGTLARPNKAPEFQDDPRWEVIGLGIEADDPARWNLTAGINAQLTLTTQMIHGVRAVAQAYRNAELELDDAKREIEKQVRTAFYQLLLQQEQLDLTRQRIDAAEARLSEIEENYQAGLVDELTLRRTQVALENQRPALLRQQQGFRTAKNSLASMIGITDIQEVEIVGSIEHEQIRLMDEHELLALVERNSDVRSVRRGIEGLEIQIGATRAEMHPTLTLAYSLNPTLNGDPFSGDVADTDLWNDRGSLSLTLRQPIDPLLPGSRTRQQLANQQDRLRQTELQVEQVRSGVELQARRLSGEIEAAGESIDSLQANVALAQRAFELAEEAYDSGLRDYSVVRDAEIDLADARLQLLQEQHRALEMTLELEYLLNTPIEVMKENDQ